MEAEKGIAIHIKRLRDANILVYCQLTWLQNCVSLASGSQVMKFQV